MVGALGCVLAALATSCVPAPPPEDAWVITPIAYDNSPDGTAGRDMVDVTYPMSHLASDSLGGFWTESAGSWLHIDDHERAARRFNLEGEMQFLRVRGISAMDSTTLVVSGHFDGEWEGGLWQFDTTTMTWTDIPTDAAVVVGDVASVGDVILYVEYLYDTSGNVGFVVRRLDEAGDDPVLSPRLDLPAGDDVTMSVTPDLSILANTGSQMLTIDPSGAVTEVAGFTLASPASSVTDEGVSAWATDPHVSKAPWYVDGGSPEARSLIETNEYCDGRSIETSEMDVSPPLCSIHALEWIDRRTLIVSTGTEGGSVLGKLRAP